MAESVRQDFDPRATAWVLFLAGEQPRHLPVGRMYVGGSCLTNLFF